jgi:hypothetical protein
MDQVPVRFNLTFRENTKLNFAAGPNKYFVLALIRRGVVTPFIVTDKYMSCPQNKIKSLVISKLQSSFSRCGRAKCPEGGFLIRVGGRSILE